MVRYMDCSLGPWVWGGAVALGLAACAGDPSTAPAKDAPPEPALTQIEDVETNGARSELIDALLARQTVVPEGSAFDTVSDAVLAHNAGLANADLRAARLRARAKARNWLPSVGPVISLTSLNDIVGQLIIEQVLYDNGRKRAERAFAAHDVEAAAVSLSADSNDRVAQALTLYINAQRARAEAEVADRARTRMDVFAGIIKQRVDGGVSNMADLSVARAKVQELAADYARAREAEATALAELSAMAGGQPLQAVDGLTPIARATGGLQPLNVLHAQAQGARGVAEATIARGRPPATGWHFGGD